MSLPQHVTVRHQMPYLKGRIVDVPGVQGGLWMLDPQGEVLTSGFSLKITGIKMTQPDPAAAPFEVATVQVTKATAEGGRQTYTVLQPVKRLLEQFPEVIREGVGEDATFDCKDISDSLLFLTLAASSKDTQHLAPTFNTLQWTEERGWMDTGKLVCSAPIEICREITNPESGEVLYRLRIERPNQPGFHDYCTCSREEVLNGNFHFPDRMISCHSAIRTSMAMFDRWGSLSEGDKVNHARAEYTQPDREAKAKRDSQFGFSTWRPEGR